MVVVDCENRKDSLDYNREGNIAEVPQELKEALNSILTKVKVGCQFTGFIVIMEELLLLIWKSFFEEVYKLKCMKELMTTQPSECQ